MATERNEDWRASERPEQHYEPTGAAMMRLFEALSRAHVAPFTSYDWDGFADAESDGAAQPSMVHFHPHDYARIAKDLGISHWGDSVVILDASGLTFSHMDDRGYAYQVVLSLRVDDWDADLQPESGYVVVPEKSYGGRDDRLMFRRSWDPGDVDSWGVYSGGPAPGRGGHDCVARFSNQRAAENFVRRSS